MTFVVIGALRVTELLINEHTYKNTKKINEYKSFRKLWSHLNFFSPSAVC